MPPPTNPTAGFVSGSAENQPEEKEVNLSNAEITDALALHLEVDFLKDELSEIVENAEKEQRRDLMRWITALKAKQGQFQLSSKLPVRNIRWVRGSFNEFLDIRRQVLLAVLDGMQNKHSKEQEKMKGANDNAFVELDSGGKLIEDQIDDIEKLLEREPPDPQGGGGGPNPLYHKNNPYIPDFQVIDEKVAIIDLALRDGIVPIPNDEGVTEEDQAATRHRLKSLKAQLAIIERMDPIG